MISRRSVVGDPLPTALQSNGVPLPAEPISVRIAIAVKLTGISRSRIYELIETGDIETKKIGRSTFVLYRSLKRLLEGGS